MAISAGVLSSECASVVSRAKKSPLPTISDVSHSYGEHDFGTQALCYDTRGLLDFRGFLGSLLQRYAWHLVLWSSISLIYGIFKREVKLQSGEPHGGKPLLCKQKCCPSHLGQYVFWSRNGIIGWKRIVKDALRGGRALQGSGLVSVPPSAEQLVLPGSGRDQNHSSFLLPVQEAVGTAMVRS